MSGLVGKQVARRLAGRHELLRLVRRASAKPAEATVEFVWDAAGPGAWAPVLETCDAVLNLAGEPIAARWTADKKKKIRDSRVHSTRALVQAISALRRRPRVLVNASAVGFYGNRGDELLTETSGPGSGFLTDTCQAWEAEALRAEALGVRVVLLRTGIVLSREGGALAKMLPPFRFGLGGPLGSGRQWMSWIHVDDEARAVVHALENEAVRGAVNLTAPEPARMGEFALSLGAALHRPAVLAAPGFVLKAVLGEMSVLLLEGQRVLPQALEASGFTFEHPALPEALKHLLTDKAA